MKCERCKSETKSFRMSWFNMDHICLACQIKEEMHPDFRKAKEKVLEEERRGNLNYKGIGLPKDLAPKKKSINNELLYSFYVVAIMILFAILVLQAVVLFYTK